MTKPAQVTLPIYQGTTFKEPLSRWYYPYETREECGRIVKECDGSPAPDSDKVLEDYTGCTARAQMRRDINSTDVIKELTTENGGIELDGDTLWLKISHTDTSAFSYGQVAPSWTQCIAHVEVVRPNGDVERHYEVTFTLDREGTR